MRDLVVFLAGRCSLLDVTSALMDLWVRSLELRGSHLTGLKLAPASIARRVAACASFYGWCEQSGVIPVSPARHVMRPAVSTDSPTVSLAVDQLARFVAQAETENGPVGVAIARLLGVNGLRVSEVVALNVEDFGGREDRALNTDGRFETRRHYTARIVGKGGKVAHVPIPADTEGAIRVVIGDRKIGPLFVSANGRRLDRFAVRRMARRWSLAAGVPVVSPHGLRHASITMQFEAGVPLADIQDTARHASPNTTRRYDRSRGALSRSGAYAADDYLARFGQSAD